MRLLSALSVCALIASGSSLLAQASHAQFRQLHKQPPKFLSHAIPGGEKSKSDLLHVSVSLRCADSVGLKKFVESVSDPRSPNYRQFIGPKQIGDRFGLPAAEVKKVTDYLKSQGFKVRLVGKNRLSILAEATVGRAETAFHTSIRKFSVAPTSAQDSGARFAFTTPPSVPSEIASDIVDVAGLENFTRPMHRALSAQQLRSAYSLDPIFSAGNVGAGRTIAVTSFDGFRISGEVQECSAFGLPVPVGGAGSNITVIPISGGAGQFSAQNQEGDLDIQAVIGMAPMCNLLVYDNDVPSGEYDPIGIYSTEADDDKADIITESYGWSFDSNTALAVHDLHLAMSAQGITYVCASGDTGTDDMGFPYPNIDPEILSVGGTSLKLNDNDQRESEVGWDNLWGASGGGWDPTNDSFNVRPSYQLTPEFLAWSAVPDPTSVPYRLWPDIALDADPNTGYIVFIQGSEVPVGGTSGAAPTTAGGLALCEQKLIFDGYLRPDANGHYRLGRLQDLLYSYNNDPSVFTDIVSGSNGFLPNQKFSTAVKGWDMVCGWGPLIFTGLVTKIENAVPIADLTLTPTSIVGGSVSTGIVKVSAFARIGPATIVLESSGVDAQVPSTVVIPVGQFAADFLVTSNGVAAPETLTIKAISGTYSRQVSITLTPADLISLNLNPTSVVGGDVVSATVALDGLAPIIGTTIKLTSDSPCAKPPATVSVLSGQSSATFNIPTIGVDSTQTANITATLGSETVTAPLVVQAASLQAISVDPTSVVGGSQQSIVGTVTLNGQAGPSGTKVTLSSSNSKYASIPASVTIPPAATSVNFSIFTVQVPTTETVTLTATQAGITQSTVLTITSFGVRTLTVSPNSVVGGSSSTGTVTLTQLPSGSGVTVTLGSNSSLATVQSSITIPSGSLTGSFPISTKVVGTPTPVTITASVLVSFQTAVLTLQPAGIQSIVLNPPSVTGGGQTSTGTVTLNGIAASGGAVVTLASSNTSVASVPAQITVLQGASTQTFTVSTSVVNSSTGVTITGTLNGTQSATLTVTPYSLASLTLNPSTVVGGLTTTGTVTLSGIAPAAGLPINLSSDNANAQCPASVLIQHGSSSASFTVSTLQVPSQVTATITATLGFSKQAAGLILMPVVLAGLNVNPSSVIGGASALGTVVLTANALPGGVSVSLTSNSADAQVPATVAVPSGKISATFNIGTRRVNATETVTITGALGQTQKTASLTITGASLNGIFLNPTSVPGGTSSTGSLTLTGPAPVGGFVVNLSSNSSHASVPPLVTIPAGLQSISFKVVTATVSVVSSATISASAYGSASLTANLLIEPAGLNAVAITPGAVVGGSTATVTGTVSLTAAALSRGVTVTLTSSSPSAASVPSSVLIPAGATSAVFKVTHAVVSATQAVTIRASAGGLTTTAVLTVSPFLITSFVVSPTSVLGGTVCKGSVTLNAAPGTKAGSQTVKLTSSSKVASVPSGVVVPINSQAGNFSITTSPVPLDTIVTLTGTLRNSVQHASLTVIAPQLISLTVAPTTVKGSASTGVTGTLTLNGNAPSGGLVVTLTSSNATVAKVPVSVTIPAGKKSATFAVSHKKVSAQTVVTIQAAQKTNTASATLTVTPG